jgi:hypothetical protein
LLILFQVKEKKNHIFRMAAVIKLLNQLLFNKNLLIIQFKLRKRILVKKMFQKSFTNSLNLLLMLFQIKERNNHIFQMDQVIKHLNLSILPLIKYHNINGSKLIILRQQLNK